MNETTLQLPHLAISALQLQILLAAQIGDDYLLYQLDKKSQKMTEILDSGNIKSKQIQQLTQRMKTQGIHLNRFLPLSTERNERSEQIELTVNWLRFFIRNEIPLTIGADFPDWLKESYQPLLEKLTNTSEEQTS